MRAIILIFFTASAALLLHSCLGKTSAAEKPDIKIEPGYFYAITADINDAEDPFRSTGINFTIDDAYANSKDLQIHVSTTNPDVVPQSNLMLTGTGNSRNLRVRAVIPGYTTIIIKVSNGRTEKSYHLDYAASLSPDDHSRRWHSGSPDASAAIAINDDQMVVANDESNLLYLYDRRISGPAIKTFDINVGNWLGLEDSSMGKWKEVDIEAGAKSIADPGVSYWIGSMSNNSAFLYKPNRNRLFAVRISGAGSSASLSGEGSYNKLRDHLIKWGDRYGYNFKASADTGKDCKAVDGFNIEGLVFAPDNKTMYIGFRAPLVPVGKRTKAVIAPIKDFESWFNKGTPSKDPQLDAPIELDLGGRGIRDMIRLPDSNYLIIAGSAGWSINPAAYTWSGKRGDKPVPVTGFELTGLNVEGVLPVSDSGQFRNRVQVFTDNGAEFFYCDTLCVKDLLEDRFKKFSSVVFPVHKQ